MFSFTDPELPDPMTVALRNLRGQYQRESAEKKATDAFMAGRMQEAKDTYDGAGYQFHLTKNKPARRAASYDSKRAPVEPDEVFASGVSNAPDPGRIYDIGPAKSQIAKAFQGHAPWQDDVLKAAQLLPVGEKLELDFGPPSNARKYHAKVSRVSRKKA